MISAERLAQLSPAARALLDQRGAERVGRDRAGEVASGDSDGRSSPLSFAQSRVWFFEQFTPGTATYNRPKRIYLNGLLDVAALRRAVREVFRRHEVLRSAIDVVEGTPSQRVLTLAADYVEILDLSRRSDVERIWVEVADAEALRTFDMVTGPLARCLLLRLAADRHVLLFTASHLAFDGWSTGVLSSEIGALYRAFVAGRESPLTDVTRPYSHFAADDAAYWSGSRTDRDVAYWKEALRGAPPAVRLPPETSKIEALDSVLLPQSVLLRPELVSALKTLGRDSDATLFMTMFAAFGVLLSRLSGLDDVVIGVPVAGRLRPGTEQLIGFFANTLPVRVRVPAGITFRALVAQVRHAALGAFDHQELPFDVLVDHLKPERSREHAPVVQTLFNFRNFSASSLDMGDLESRIENVATGASALALGFDLEERPDGVLCIAEYNRKMFAASTVTRWLSHYECILEGAVRNPDEDVTRLPLLTDLETGIR